MHAITADNLKRQLGRILRELREGDEEFVVFRRNVPVGVLMNLEEYVKAHADEYEDVRDFLDTLVEESDPEFQISLRRAAGEIRRGRYLSHTRLKLALAEKKF
ncbi:type II toxin-antitoxin system Phd/YefM family antitoxin [Acidobacteriia bacterium AH_259_A11_L15]|nr:type II toxin-antitoxin system Phd/YefM family antitoxin [Acidobacteriia bacterium AH_259_A11_L15]